MEVASFIFALLIFFQIKHFLADYPLQNSFMLGKFKPGWDFVLPLVAHAGVHAVFTFGLCLFVAPHLWWLALVDFVVHFIMDRVKAGPKYLGRYKALSANEFRNVMQNRHIAFLQSDQQGINEENAKLKGNVHFWWALGLDQMVHHVTHYYIIFALTMDKVIGC